MMMMMFNPLRPVCPLATCLELLIYFTYFKNIDLRELHTLIFLSYSNIRSAVTRSLIIVVWQLISDEFQQPPALGWTDLPALSLRHGLRYSHVHADSDPGELCQLAVPYRRCTARTDLLLLLSNPEFSAPKTDVSVPGNTWLLSIFGAEAPLSKKLTSSLLSSWSKIEMNWTSSAFHPGHKAWQFNGSMQWSCVAACMFIYTSLE